MTASVRLARTEEPWTRFPARSSGASSVRVAAIVRPSALAAPAVKPSSASLRSGRRSHATATGSSMSNWPIAGTATADASTPPLVSDVASPGTSESETTGPSRSAQTDPERRPGHEDDRRRDGEACFPRGDLIQVDQEQQRDRQSADGDHRRRQACHRQAHEQHDDEAERDPVGTAGCARRAAGTASSRRRGGARLRRGTRNGRGSWWRRRGLGRASGALRTLRRMAHRGPGSRSAGRRSSGTRKTGRACVVVATGRRDHDRPVSGARSRARFQASGVPRPVTMS